MLTRRAKAYSSSGSVVTHHSTNRARRRVTSFQSKRVTNYATPPTPVPWRHLVNDIDLRSPKSLKSLTPACAGLHEPRGSGLRLLKSTFNAENFTRRLSWSISSHFVAIQYWMCAASKYCKKFTKNPFWEGSRSFKVIDVNKFKKPVTSASYDKQHVCAYLQPCSCYTW